MGGRDAQLVGQVSLFLGGRLSRLRRETYCCRTRGIVFGLVSVGELEVEEGSWIGTLTGLEKGVMGA